MEDTARIVALVPAYNEEDQIAQTIESLLAQTLRIDKILIIPNNCTDNTVAIANEYAATYDNVEVLEIPKHKGKKAGALNTALLSLNPADWDYVLQMDADTELDSRLVEMGIKEFRRNPKLGGISSRCFLKPYSHDTPFWGRLLWRFQNIEYGMSDSAHFQRNGKAKVLAGAVCIYRMETLRHVAKTRKKETATSIIWQESSIVEDYELTLDVQRLGYDTKIGMKMFSRTDAMLNIKELKNQRSRWYGGTVATIRRRGFAREIRREIMVQLFYITVILTRFGIALLWLSIPFLVPLAQLRPQVWSLPIIGLVMANYLYRFSFVRNKDLGQFLIVSTLIPIELYVTWDQSLTLISYVKNAVKPSKNW